VSAGAQVDYDAIAQKYGGAPDTDAIAKKYGGTAASNSKNDAPGIQQVPGGPVYHKGDVIPPVPHSDWQRVAKGTSEGIAKGLGISTPSPNQSLPSYMLQSAGQIGKNMLPILKDPLVGISHGIDNMATSVEDAGRQIYKGIGSPKGLPDYSSSARIDPERLSHGIGQAVAIGAPIAATEVGNPAVESAESAVKAPGKVRSYIGKTVFNPEGKLTPVGEAIAHPIDKGTEFGLRKLFPPPQPEGVGATEPNASDFYQNKAETLMERGKAQDSLERADMTNRTIRTANDPFQQQGDALMERGKAQDSLERADMTNRTIRTANDPFQQRGDALMRRGVEQNALDVIGQKNKFALAPIDSSEEGIASSLANPSGRIIKLPSELETGPNGELRPAGYGQAKLRARENGMFYASGSRPAFGGKVPGRATPTQVFENPAVPRSVTKFPWIDEEEQ